MKLNQAISQRLTTILNERNLTQYQLFKISGVPRSTIGNIVNCFYDSIKLRVIHEICMGLEMSITDFFTSPLFDMNNLED